MSGPEVIYGFEIKSDLAAEIELTEAEQIEQAELDSLAEKEGD